jgi:hypothetical protein
MALFEFVACIRIVKLIKAKEIKIKIKVKIKNFYINPYSYKK